VTGVSIGSERIEVSLVDGSRHVHSRSARGWHVDFLASGARSSIDLGGLRAPGAASRPPTVGVYGDATAASTRPKSPAIALTRAPRSFVLGAEHYRRTEESWEEAGSPTAAVTVAWTGTELALTVDVHKRGDPIFAPRDAVNRYDNEQPDINGDGLQLYLRTPTGSGAWVLVPDDEDAVRVRSVPGWGALPPPHASWRRTTDGYVVRLTTSICDAPPAGAIPVQLDLVVNESSVGRERRRGQLVLSGASGEFAYLAGDRHDPDRLLDFVLEP
jgi:hypothetical protein